jgi:wyosine [tRNA(Phe)-imidazoG37] synthetase (radical SAM superfamily)
MKRKFKKASLDWEKLFIDYLEGCEMLLELKKGIIYGPVNSRRLGWSLGINILPPGKKACPFNCVYCQYGWTNIHNIHLRNLSGLPSVQEVNKAMNEALIELPAPPAYITFSGNGEPTLHPEFEQIVGQVLMVRNRLAPKTKTAILSNSALVTDKTVQKALEKLDVRIMKLDCGSPDVFKKYNNPCNGLDLEEITDGLVKLSNVTIQTLVSSGKPGNLDLKNIIDWIGRLKRIKPVFVQLYTLDRDYPFKELKAATKDELYRVRTQVQAAGISVDVF